MKLIELFRDPQAFYPHNRLDYLGEICRAKRTGRDFLSFKLPQDIHDWLVSEGFRVEKDYEGYRVYVPH